MAHLALFAVLVGVVGVDAPASVEGGATGEALVAPAVSMTPFDIDLTAHAVANGGLIAVMATYQLFIRDDLDGGLTCKPPSGEPRCDANDINAFDRTVVGKKSNDLLLSSDILNGVLILGALTGTAVDAWSSGSGTPGTDFLTDAVVVTEAAVLATALAHLFKFAIRRPRPTQYAEVGSIASIEHQLAFPSGHATVAAALAAAYTTTFWLRHPESPWRWVVLAGTSSMAVAAGTVRAVGGFHWPTDIIAGLALGATTGFLVPYVLRRETSLIATPIIGPEGARGVEVVWQF
jgi:membrane-associated phospholipid phosphatase